MNTFVDNNYIRKVILEYTFKAIPYGSWRKKFIDKLEGVRIGGSWDVKKHTFKILNYKLIRVILTEEEVNENRNKKIHTFNVNMVKFALNKSSIFNIREAVYVINTLTQGKKSIQIFFK